MRLRLLLVLVLALAAASASAQTAPGALAGPLTRERTDASVPIVKQVYRNNCETAALSMLLAAAGVSVDQRELQRRVAKSGDPDPTVGPDGTWTWGDPAVGFVGRVMGGGTAGGFGVYEGPIRDLAATYGVAVVDLSRKPIGLILDRLRAGRPVMAWIGLSEGPYRRWRTPSGRLVTANFGEHAVVLTGVRGGVLSVNDPLSGTRLYWTVAQFTKMWWRLGKRALAL